MHVKLPQDLKQRQEIDAYSELYSIIVTTEHLERAFINASIQPDFYTPSMQTLLSQYKTLVQLTPIVLSDFLLEWRLDCPAGFNRLQVGVPATFEYSTNTSTTSKVIAETVQLFITLMDSLKLNLIAVDQIHPLLSDLIQSITRVTSLPSSYSGKAKIREWLVIVNKLKASDELSQDQTRQLLFDLESAHSEFHNAI